jgi:hypothetical protein
MAARTVASSLGRAMSELSTITRFFVRARDAPDEEPWLWSCTTARHWNLDRPDPR